MSIHAVPLNDELEHDLTADCWCNPLVEWLDPDTGMPWASGLGAKVTHNAADCREVAERVTGECVEAGKEWTLLDDDVNEFAIP